jgi:hypothetical protein
MILTKQAIILVNVGFGGYNRADLAKLLWDNRLGPCTPAFAYLETVFCLCLNYRYNWLNLANFRLNNGDQIVLIFKNLLKLFQTRQSRKTTDQSWRSDGTTYTWIFSILHKFTFMKRSRIQKITWPPSTSQEHLRSILDTEGMWSICSMVTSLQSYNN